MPIPYETSLALWTRAREAEIGIAFGVQLEDIRRIQIELYEARQKSHDESLEDIVMVLPNGGKEIWLVKKTVELDAP